MKENVGRIDRLARAVVGPALLLLGHGPLGGGRGRPAGLAAIVSGALMIETAITRVCPLSALLGIDTRSQAERERDRLALWPETPLRAPETVMPTTLEPRPG